jgi:raffinose/stachyose/melibiose transport system substrate-binding protein
MTKADRDWVDRYQRYTGATDFHDEVWTFAADTFADWVRKGYIAKSATGVKAQDMGNAFMAGKFPMMVSGSWWFGELKTKIKSFEWDSFLWPSTMSAASSGNLWVVPQGSKNKDLAYDFIDITMKKESQNLLGNSGGVPVAADPAAITDPKSKALIENFSTLAGRDGLAYYPDWPVPGYYDVLVSAGQKLINGSAPPAKVLDELAKPYQENAAGIGG